MSKDEALQMADRINAHILCEMLSVLRNLNVADQNWHGTQNIIEKTFDGALNYFIRERYLIAVDKRQKAAESTPINLSEAYFNFEREQDARQK